MMAVNGTTNPPALIWEQSASVQQNTKYVVALSTSTWVSRGIIQVNVNGSILEPLVVTPEQTGLWMKHFLLWNSGSATTATVSLLNVSSELGGNDFAIDDIKLYPVE